MKFEGVEAFSEKDIDRRTQDQGFIKMKQEIESVIHSPNKILTFQKEYGSLKYRLI